MPKLAAFWDALADKHPMGRIGSAEESAAAAIAFPREPRRPFVTGLAIPVQVAAASAEADIMLARFL